MSRVSMSLSGLIPPKLLNENSAKALTFIPFFAKKTKMATTICCTRLDNSSQSNPTTQQLNLSVLRFTFGIPGFDESYLPRWIGYAFGSLLLLNHFVGSDTSAITPAQLRTEVLGICLAAFSVVLPYLGKFLKGSTPFNEKSIPDGGAEQIFVLSPSITESLKEDLAWGSYVLLRNTNTTSVIISVKGVFCVRGYWNNIEALSKDRVENLFKKWTKKIGLFELTDSLYLPQAGDMKGWDMLPRETRSILVEPILHQAQNVIYNVTEEKSEGFILLASCSSYAYSNEDRSWIQSVAKKFKELWLRTNLNPSSSAMTLHRVATMVYHTKTTIVIPTKTESRSFCQSKFMCPGRKHHEAWRGNQQPLKVAGNRCTSRMPWKVAGNWAREVADMTSALVQRTSRV